MSSYSCVLCDHSVMYHDKDRTPPCSACDCKVYVSASSRGEGFGEGVQTYHACGVDIDGKQVAWVSWNDTYPDADTYVRYADGSLLTIEGEDV